MAKKGKAPTSFIWIVVAHGSANLQLQYQEGVLFMTRRSCLASHRPFPC